MIFVAFYGIMPAEWGGNSKYPKTDIPFERGLLKMSIIRSCDNCIFSTFAATAHRPELICRQRKNREGQWNIQPLNETCENFYPSRIAGSKKNTSARVIPLTRGKFAIVDADNYHELAKFKWFTESAHNTFYAARKQNGKSIKMHRQITNAPDHLVVDHIDHNGLNNRKSNLRLCTFAENAKNINSFAPNTSAYKGVHWHKNLKKWAAQITSDKRSHHLGYFESQLTAAKAYDNAAKKLHGEFATTNF